MLEKVRTSVDAPLARRASDDAQERLARDDGLRS